MENRAERVGGTCWSGAEWSASIWSTAESWVVGQKPSNLSSRTKTLKTSAAMSPWFTHRTTTNLDTMQHNGLLDL